MDPRTIAKEAKLTQARLKELLHYDPLTGIFTRLVGVQGVDAGHVQKPNKFHGYVFIEIDGEKYRAHRLAWFYVHGRWPSDQLDHRDRNKAHNWISNLREATDGQNRQNMSMRSDNGSGHTGVSWDKGRNKWMAQIKVDGRQHYLGRFDDVMDASEAYKKAKAILHPFNQS